jgi:hypothetical protein
MNQMIHHPQAQQQIQSQQYKQQLPTAALVENLLASTGFPCRNLQITLESGWNNNSDGVDAILDCLFALVTQIQVKNDLKRA